MVNRFVWENFAQVGENDFLGKKKILSLNFHISRLPID